MRLISVFLMLLVLALPLQAQDGKITTGIGASQDAAIATRIRDIKSELDGYADVTVVVNAGIVTLRGKTLDADAAKRLVDLAARVDGVVAVENQITETTDLAERLAPALDRFETRVNQMIAMLPLLAVAFAVFLLVTFAGFALARLRQPWARLAPNEFIADILRAVLRLVSVLAGIVIALDILGATALLSTFLGAAGIIGLALSFAVKDTVENFIASVMLSIRQPFQPNDTVEIEGDEGKVVRLTSRATILMSFDGNQIRIPNSTVFKARIVNYTRNPERRFTFTVNLSYQSDLSAARNMAEKTLAALPFVIKEPAPSCWIEHMGDSAITMTCTAWIDQYSTNFNSARSEAMRMVKGALEGTKMTASTEQTVRIIRDETAEKAGKQVPAKPQPKADLSLVSTKQEDALEKIVDAERRDANAPDLLSDKTATE